MAAISAVYTIGRVAEMLGEDEDWLQELSIQMDPEDGCLCIVGSGGETVAAFTEYGVQCLREIIAIERQELRNERYASHFGVLLIERIRYRFS